MSDLSPTDRTSYRELCEQHGVNPDTAVWRVLSVEEMPKPLPMGIHSDHSLVGCIVALDNDDGSDLPAFVSVFPVRSDDYHYIHLARLAPLKQQEVADA